MKITKTQLKRIIKEELEAVMGGDENLGIDDLLKEPVEIPDSGLNEDAGIISVPLAVVLGGLTGIGSLFIRNYFRNKRKRENEEKFRQIQAQVPNELILLYETIKTDPVLRNKIEKYFEILEVVEKNKGKRSKELAVVRKAAKELSPEISGDIQRIMEKFASGIPDSMVRKLVTRDSGFDDREMRKRLLKDIADAAAPSSAITSDVNAALKAVQATSAVGDWDSGQEKASDYRRKVKKEKARQQQARASQRNKQL
jgi:hypothetical protein